VRFSKTNISQGSVEAPLRCGGICNDYFIANFLPRVPMKEFKNWSIFGKDMEKSLVSFFMTRGVIIILG